MRKSDMTRRSFMGAALTSAAASRLHAAADGWTELFDGRSLEGWRQSENQGSWKVADGHLYADGPRSHLFYAGPVRGADFRNFELELEALAYPGCNSGVYFHTAYQEKGWPQKGLEVQINNTATGAGNYRERKKTGSLYGIRNMYKQLVPDNEWFRMHVAVRGKNVQVRVDGMLLVDFTEATPPVLADNERGRFLDRGTFALQCHDPDSKARFRSIRVRPLADTADAGTAPPVVDDVYRKIIEYGARNIPMVDFHVHPKGGLSVEQALAQSRRDGIQYGLAVNCGKGHEVEDDDGARRFLDRLKGQPAFVAMQAEGREWTRMFSRRTAALFDYIFTDSMTWTDNRGRRMRLWMPKEVGTIPDPREFMDLLVERTIWIMEQEPVDIYVNPTFLPDAIAADYDRLWTEERMRKVVGAAVRNMVAIEINDRYRLPSPAFLRMAKAAGCKFTFGTNNGGARDLGRSEYGLRMVEECKLVWQDFWVPDAWYPRAIERKGEALRA
jgi:hypothetical protein